MVTNQPDAEREYDIEYDNSFEATARSSLASSSTNSYPKVNCDDDDEIMDCPSNRNIKICGKQFCNGIADCPNSEDENPEQCPVGEF